MLAKDGLGSHAVCMQAITNGRRFLGQSSTVTGASWTFGTLITTTVRVFQTTSSLGAGERHLRNNTLETRLSAAWGSTKTTSDDRINQISIYSLCDPLFPF